MGSIAFNRQQKNGLSMSELKPVRVFIGADPRGDDAESMAVLEYTIRKHTTGPVEITWMRMNKDDPKSPWYIGSGGWNTEVWPTPFSGFRWGIPWATGYIGKAVYMDSDMVVQRDLRELFETPISANKIVAAKSPDRFCVCVWDCEAFGRLVKARALPDAAEARQNAHFHNQMKAGFMANAHLIEFFDPDWNNFDGENRPLEEAKIIHYTDMSSQIHGKYAIPRLKGQGRTHWFDGEFRPHPRTDLQDLFDRLYREAREAGYTVDKYVPKDDFGNIKKLSQKGYVAQHGYAR